MKFSFPVLAAALWCSTAAAIPDAKVTWVALPAASASTPPSLLGVPDECLYTSCPLVTVSHPRGQTPERLRESPSFNVLSHALLHAHYAVLLSSDGGPTSWGSPGAYQQVADAHAHAVPMFRWNRRTYALGLSMGGLMALRSAQPGAEYPVSGLALIDAWTNLPVAWQASPGRQDEIRKAYQTDFPPNAEGDLLRSFLQGHRLPMFIAASPDDRVVPMQPNSVKLYQYALKPSSQFVTLRGPHLGGNRFTTQLAAQLVNFFQHLERQAIQEEVHENAQQ